MNYKKGFTLLEILLVLAILTVLVALVVFYVRPDEILPDANRVGRDGTTIAIEKALQNYAAENRGNYPFDKEAIEEGTVYFICKYGVTCSGDFIDLDILVDEGYLPEIPIDEKNDTETNSGYVITKDITDSLIVDSVADMPPIPVEVATNEIIYQIGAAFGQINDVATDTAGNTYYIGHKYGGTGTVVDFDPTSGVDNKTHLGENDIFFGKINSNGTYGWTYLLGAAGDDMAGAIAIDSDGSIYITGGVEGTADFNPFGGTDQRTSSNTSRDFFVTKINSDLSYGWTNIIYDSNFDNEGTDLYVDEDNNVFAAGRYYGFSVDFNPGAGQDLKSVWNGFDSFVSVYGSDGSYQYSRWFGGDANGKLALDSADNLYLIGRFSSNDNFNKINNTDNKVSNGNWDSYLTKYNSDGTYGWTYAWGSNSGYGDHPTGIEIDGNDNIYLTGSFNGTNVDLDPTGTSDLKSSVGELYNIFLTKLNSDYTYDWTYTFASSGAGDVIVDSNDDVLFGGSFTGTVDLDPTDGVTEKTSTGGYDAFLMRIDEDGDFKWVNTFGSSRTTPAPHYGDDAVHSLIQDNSGNVWVGGEYEGRFYGMLAKFTITLEEQ